MKNLKIKMARMELNMSQEELGNKVGATRQTIGLIESGRYNPSIKLCINICIALHKHLDDLFWDESYDKEEL
ncbi:helix-turn-helix transcriptional regulator [Candidatus Stoquefichus massiliensis]|uniref:helix-turn-helix transcriptional regulator n=1 Tax=Candidatus Stoquefichus massiliensis TaxID=1470350 RepID=UPI000488A5E7|nr:helix-turn-helix transcriptional regulator [Candidatus Stoquefichus massiliensis]